jgi:hypothetical protein
MKKKKKKMHTLRYGREGLADEREQRRAEARVDGRRQAQDLLHVRRRFEQTICSIM